MVQARLIKVITLVRPHDLEGCRLAACPASSLWLRGEKTVLERLLVHLAGQGVRHVAVCSCGLGTLLAELLRTPSGLLVSLLDDPLPVGAAGCIRHAAGDETDALLVVFSATILCPPKIGALVAAHQDGKSDLTVIFNPGADRQIAGDSGYCRPSIEASSLRSR